MVFSRTTRRETGTWASSGRMAARMLAGITEPSGSTSMGFSAMPPRTDVPAASLARMW